jgi:hypothetical protein
VPVRAGEPVYTAGRFRIAADRGVEALAGVHTIVIPGRDGRQGGNTADGMNPWLRICADVMKK